MKKTVFIRKCLIFLLISICSISLIGAIEPLVVKLVNYSGPQSIKIDDLEIGRFELSSLNNAIQAKARITKPEWLMVSIRIDVINSGKNYIFSKYFYPLGDKTFEQNIDLESIEAQAETPLDFIIQIEVLSPGNCIPEITRFGFNYN